MARKSTESAEGRHPTTYGELGENEVFEPKDRPEGDNKKRYYIRGKGEPGTALRVRKAQGTWKPFDERPLHAEQSFFPPEEPGQVVGKYPKPPDKEA